MRRFKLLPIQILLGIAVFLTSCSKEKKSDRRLEAAKAYLKKNDYSSAEIELKSALGYSPGNVEALTKLGTLYIKQGITLEGTKILAAARAKKGNDPEIELNFARGLHDLAFIGDSRKELLAILDRDPTNDEALLLLSESSIDPSQIDECEKRLKNSGPNVTSIRLLASALLELRQGRTAAGEALTDKALTLTPESPRANCLKARIHQSKKQLELAISSMKKASDLGGPRSEETTAYATLLMQLNREDQAIRLLKDATNKTPDYLPNWRILGKIALAGKRFDEATEYFQKSISKNPVDIETGILMAQIFVQQDQAPKAVDLLEKITFAIPSRPAVDLSLAKAYLATKDPRKASIALDRVLAANPKIIEAISLKAHLLLQENKPKEAIDLVNPAAEANPENSELEDLLIDSYATNNQSEEAIKSLKEKITKNPNDPAALLKLGKIYQSLKKYPEASAEYTRSLNQPGDQFQALASLVEIDQLKGSVNEAMDRVTGYLADHPKSTDAILLKAKIFMSQNDYLQAEKVLSDLIAEKPSNVEAHNLLISIFTKNDRLDDSVKTITKLLELSTENQFGLRMLLGEQLVRLNRNDEAIQCFEKTVAIYPESAAPHNNLAYLYSEIKKDLNVAHASALKARQLSPKDPMICDTLGWIEYQRGNHNEALLLLEEATSTLKNQPSMNYRLAMIYDKLGRTNDSIVELKKSLAFETLFSERESAKTKLASLVSNEDSEETLLKKSLSEPTNITVQLKLADHFSATGKFLEAINVYDKIISFNPRSEAGYLGLASIYLSKLKNPTKALDAARQARKVNPESLLAKAALGSANLENSNYDEAYSLLKEVSSSSTDGGELQFSFAKSAYYIGKVEESLNVFENLKKLEFDSKQESNELFLLIDPKQNLDRKILDRANTILKQQPNHLPSLMLRAKSSEKSATDSIAIYEKILSLYPKFDPARKNLALIYSADPTKLEQAESLVIEARKRMPDDLELTSLLANLSFRKSKYDYAAQLYSELSNARDLSGSELLSFGRCQIAGNKLAEARSNLTKALSCDLNASEIKDAKLALESINNK